MRGHSSLGSSISGLRSVSMEGTRPLENMRSPMKFFSTPNISILGETASSMASFMLRSISPATFARISASSASPHTPASTSCLPKAIMESCSCHASISSFVL